MTLEDGKRKALMLLDEYGTGEKADADLNAKMADFFDLAQKQVASIQHIVKETTVTPEGNTQLYDMPADFEKALRITKNGKALRRTEWVGRKLRITDGESVTVEYIAAPETIGPDTPEDHVFEVSEIACQAMPFFVAGSVLAGDAVQSPKHYLSLWQAMLAGLGTETPGSGGFRQTFWR